MNIIEDDLTPAHLRCSLGGCPAVLKTADGDLIIIGKALSDALRKQIEGRVGDDEVALKISPEFFKGLFK